MKSNSAPATAITINPTWVYFVAGTDDEEESLFGSITKTDQN